MKTEEFMERMNEEVRALAETPEFLLNYYLEDLREDNAYPALRFFNPSPRIVSVYSWRRDGCPEILGGMSTGINHLEEFASMGLCDRVGVKPSNVSSWSGAPYYKIEWGIFKDFSGVPQDLDELKHLSFGEPYGAIFARPWGLKTDFESVTKGFKLQKGDIDRGISGPKKGWSLEKAIEHIFKCQTPAMLKDNFYGNYYGRDNSDKYKEYPMESPIADKITPQTHPKFREICGYEK